MPIAVSVAELQPGMRLARSVRNEWSTLVTSDTVINQQQIDRMVRLRVEGPVLIVDPLLDSCVEFEDDSADQDAATRIHRQMVETLGQVEEKFRASTNLGAADFVGLQQAIADVMEDIENCPVRSAFLIKAQSADEYLKFHSSNVFYLSMLMGRELRDYILRERVRQTSADKLHRPMNLAPLGLGAMLHDIAMLPLLPIIRKAGRLTTEELDQIRVHPVVGADMPPEGFSPAARTVIRQHHESADGTGYPDGRLARETHIFARIVRMADAYDAATSQTLYRDARDPWRVLHEITRGAWRHQFDPTLAKVFLSVIQPFPTGARVLLNTGEYGVVVRHNARQPFAPVVIVAFDRLGARIPAERLQKPVDLARRSDVRLEAYQQKQLGFVHRATPPLVVRRTPEQARSAFELAYP